MPDKTEISGGLTTEVEGRSHREPSEDRRVVLRFEKFSSFVEEYASYLSLGGVFLRTPALREIGDSVEFEIAMSDGYRLAEGVGEVVWRRSKGKDPTRPAGMCLRFTALDQQGRELILKILEEQVKSGGEPFEVDAIPPDAEVGSDSGRPVGDQELDETEEPTLITGRARAAEGSVGVSANVRLQSHLDFDAPWGKALPDLPSEVLDDSGAAASTAGRITEVMAARSPQSAAKPEVQTDLDFPAEPPAVQEEQAATPDSASGPALSQLAEDAMRELEASAERGASFGRDSFSERLDAATAEPAGDAGRAISQTPDLEQAVEEIFSVPQDSLGEPRAADDPESPRDPKITDPPSPVLGNDASPTLTPALAGSEGWASGLLPRAPESAGAESGRELPTTSEDVQAPAVAESPASGRPILDYEGELEDQVQDRVERSPRARIAKRLLPVVLIVAAIALGYRFAGNLLPWNDEMQPGSQVGGSRVSPPPPGEPAQSPAAAGLTKAEISTDSSAREEPAARTGLQATGPDDAALALSRAVPSANDGSGGRGAPDQPEGAATRITKISWRTTDLGTLVSVDLDGDLAMDRVIHDRLAWTSTKEQLSLVGIPYPFHPATLQVGTRELDRIRTGYHSGAEGPEIRLVFDFRAGGIELAELHAAATGLQVLVREAPP